MGWGLQLDTMSFRVFAHLSGSLGLSCASKAVAGGGVGLACLCGGFSLGHKLLGRRDSFSPTPRSVHYPDPSSVPPPTGSALPAAFPGYK